MHSSQSTHKLDMNKNKLLSSTKAFKMAPKINSKRDLYKKVARREKVNLADSESNTRNSQISNSSAERMDKLFGPLVKGSSITSKILKSTVTQTKLKKTDFTQKSTSDLSCQYYKVETPGLSRIKLKSPLSNKNFANEHSPYK